MTSPDELKIHSCEDANPDVFISYSRHDAAIADQFVSALQEKGLRIWWDRLIQQNRSFRVSLTDALEAAHCVLVLWSSNAARSEWVEREANMAQRAKKLIELALDDNFTTPFGFGDNTLSFVGWNQSEKSDCFITLLGRISKFVPELHSLEKVELGFRQHILDVESNQFYRLRVPGSNHFSSFQPATSGNKFVRIRMVTTDAWIPKSLYNTFPQEHEVDVLDTADFHDTKFVKVRSEVFNIRDPIRPFETQIGLTRSLRPGANPGEIVGELDPKWLEGWYMQIDQPEFRWIRMAIAEIVTSPEALKFIARRAKENDDEKIHQLACKNPYAPRELQESVCLFCDPEFSRTHEVFADGEAFIFPNDYPFGPYFHYVVSTKKRIHSWGELNKEDFVAMNNILHTFLNDRGRRNLRGACGVGLGLNSTVRHLVLGQQTHSSAGASISHIHKQVWGLTPRSGALANHIVEICNAYEQRGVDYLGEYLNTLRSMHCVLWEDKNVALYVPLGQTSLHELQAMVIDPKSNFLELDPDEIQSISEAEYRVVQLFKSWNINSFNEVVINNEFEESGEAKCSNFRVIVTFITREVDLAVSELNLMYVVDHQPSDTVRAFWRCREKTGISWE